MDPVIGKTHPQQKLWYKVFSMLEESKDQDRLDMVNMIGRLRPVYADSEFYILLHQAGIDTIRHIAQSKTLEEFQEMGRARLNIVGSSLGIQSAKRMEYKNGIPYIEAYPTFHPDVVHEMYQKLSQILGVRLDDDELYHKTKKRMEGLARKLEGKTIAVGESYAGLMNSFQAAVELRKQGMHVKYVLCDGFLHSKEAEIEWLAEHAPDVQVVIMSHPSMVQVVDQPLDVDIAIGTHEDWFYRRPETLWITMERIQHDSDYASIHRFIDMVESGLESDREEKDEETI